MYLFKKKYTFYNTLQVCPANSYNLGWTRLKNKDVLLLHYIRKKKRKEIQ